VVVAANVTDGSAVVKLTANRKSLNFIIIPYRLFRTCAFSPDGVIQKNQRKENLTVECQHPAVVFPDNPENR
jgi:hypothetical protein